MSRLLFFELPQRLLDSGTDERRPLPGFSRRDRVEATKCFLVELYQYLHMFDHMVCSHVEQALAVTSPGTCARRSGATAPASLIASRGVSPLVTRRGRYGIGAAMKRFAPLGILSLGVVSVVAVSVVVQAAPISGSTMPVAPPPAKTLDVAPEPPPPISDLGIVDLSVDSECRIVVHMQNVGGATLPAATEVSLTMSAASNALGGWKLSGNSIPHAPGEIRTYTVQTYKVNGAVSVKGVFAGYVDGTPYNNSRTEVLECASKFPDLAVSVSVKPDCSKVIEVSNVGDGPPMANTWLGAITRSVDGLSYSPLSLSVIDPNKALQNPGGKATYLEPATFRAYDRYSYSWSYSYQEKNNNKTNNSAAASMPASCKGTRPPVDVAISDLRLDANCRLLAKAKNAGANLLPPVRITTSFFKDGQAAGQWGFDLSGVSAPGAEGTIYGPSLKETSPIAVKAVLDANSMLAETREDNNTATGTLSCGSFTPSIVKTAFPMPTSKTLAK